MCPPLEEEDLHHYHVDLQALDHDKSQRDARYKPAIRADIKTAETSTFSALLKGVVEPRAELDNSVISAGEADLGGSFCLTVNGNNMDKGENQEDGSHADVYKDFRGVVIRREIYFCMKWEDVYLLMQFMSISCARSLSRSDSRRRRPSWIAGRAKQEILVPMIIFWFFHQTGLRDHDEEKSIKDQ